MCESFLHSLHHVENADTPSAGKTPQALPTLQPAQKNGVKSAYAAVINPTEGTILTVARETADFAALRITDEGTPESFGEDYLET